LDEGLVNRIHAVRLETPENTWNHCPTLIGVGRNQFDVPTLEEVVGLALPVKRLWVSNPTVES
jgi:hypothetical protein